VSLFYGVLKTVQKCVENIAFALNHCHIATVKPNWAMSKNRVLRKWQKTKLFELEVVLPFHLI